MHSEYVSGLISQFSQGLGTWLTSDPHVALGYVTPCRDAYVLTQAMGSHLYHGAIRQEDDLSQAKQTFHRIPFVPWDNKTGELCLA